MPTPRPPVPGARLRRRDRAPVAIAATGGVAAGDAAMSSSWDAAGRLARCLPRVLMWCLDMPVAGIGEEATAAAVVAVGLAASVVGRRGRSCAGAGAPAGAPRPSAATRLLERNPAEEVKAKGELREDAAGGGGGGGRGAPVSPACRMVPEIPSSVRSAHCGGSAVEATPSPETDELVP